MIEYKENGDMGIHTPILYTITRAIKPEVVLEIGIRHGVSTKSILSAVIDGDICAEYNGCDINSKCFNPKSLYENSLLHSMTSDDLYRKWDKNIDLFMIDGDHDYEQVYKDYINFSKYVNVNGFMVFHDTYPPNNSYKALDRCGTVFKILGDLKYDRRFEYITLPWSMGLTICRRIS